MLLSASMTCSDVLMGADALCEIRSCTMHAFACLHTNRHKQPARYICVVCCDSCHTRSEALRVLSEAFAAAARPSKGGFVRDALTSSYPRLVSLLESTVNRIVTDSRIKVSCATEGLLGRCLPMSLGSRKANPSPTHTHVATGLHQLGRKHGTRVVPASCHTLLHMQGVAPTVLPEQLPQLLDATHPSETHSFNS
jgi:hypothetical protein